MQRNEKTIYVVGNSRSGTTLMGQVLGRNKKIFCFHELHFFEHIWKPGTISKLSKEQSVELLALLLSVQRDDYLAERRPDLYKAEADKLLNTIDQELWTPPGLYRSFLSYEVKNHNKQIACEQTPRNLYYLNEILNLYPDALAVLMVRDPRSVLLSQKNKWRIRSHGADNFPVREVIRSWVNYHPITISLLWKSAANTAKNYTDNPKVKTLKFEDFVNDPQQSIVEICQFIGEDFDEDMLNVSQTEGGVSSLKSLHNANFRGIDKNTANSWQRGGLSSTEIFICQKITKTAAENFGYKTTDNGLNIFLLAFYVFYFPIHLVLATLLNLSRVSSITDTIKRRLF